MHLLLGRGGHVCVHESDVYIGVSAHTKRLRFLVKSIMQKSSI